MSFSPYANRVDEWMQQAEELGYQLLIDLPLEPADYPNSDAGPYSLLSESDKKYNDAQLNTVLQLAPKTVFGVTAPINEKYTFAEKAILSTLADLTQRKLIFVYNNQPRNYFLPQVAKQKGFNIIAYDFLVDEALSHEAINETLAKAKEAAQHKGFAVLLARPYPITVDALHSWLKTFRDEGLVLVPLSTITGTFE